MMLPLATAMLLGAAAGQVMVTPDRLPSLFVAACLNGSVRPSDWSATRIDFGGMPAAVRRDLGKPSEAQAWKVYSSYPAYLYVLSYADRDSRVCGVASEGLQLRDATAAVEARLLGRTSAGGAQMNGTEWLDEKAGYRALAIRKGGYTVLQLNWLNKDHAESQPKQ